MNPYSQCSASSERPPVEEIRFNTIMQKLRRIANRLDDDDPVYINGETLNADEFRLVLGAVKTPTFTKQ
jgi:hypothetical protein